MTVFVKENLVNINLFVRGKVVQDMITRAELKRDPKYKPLITYLKSKEFYDYASEANARASDVKVFFEILKKKWIEGDFQQPLTLSDRWNNYLAQKEVFVPVPFKWSRFIKWQIKFKWEGSVQIKRPWERPLIKKPVYGRDTELLDWIITAIERDVYYGAGVQRNFMTTYMYQTIHKYIA